MYEYYPLLAIGAIIGVISAIFIIAYATMKNKKESIGFDRNMKDSEIIKRLLKYARPYTKSFVLAIIVMIISISYDILSPVIVGLITESLQNGELGLRELFIYVALYLSMLVVMLVCTYIQVLVLQKVGQKIISKMREDLFLHIEGLSHSQLNSTPVGTLVTRVTNDTESVSVMFTNIIVNLLKNCLIILGVFVAMMMLNRVLTLMVLCFVPFIVLFTIIFRKFSRRAYRRTRDGTTAINTFLSENLSGMRIIQIFNRENKKADEFSVRNKELYRAKRQQLVVAGIFHPLVYMLYIACIMFLFYISGRSATSGLSLFGHTVTVSASVLVSFYMYINKFFNPIQSLADQFNWLQAAFASSEKIFTILDIQPDVTDTQGAVELDEVKGEIEFRNVWFSYVPDEWVLRGVSFKVEAKQTVAFVGSTGSGKTTILSLLCRNYDIQKGQILVDGIDIKNIKISSLRKHFGQMLQDVFLFSGDIRSNIVLRRDDISDEEIMEACRYVNADKFIDKLPHGLDEQVRERGNNFSAGQRQLLSFARTIIHKPAVMILDEATANIDTETEILIQDSLEKMMNIGTMLIVAHRLSTIQHADKIIVLSHGEIIEEGNHFELLEKKGKYHGLYMLQYDKERLQKK